MNSSFLKRHWKRKLEFYFYFFQNKFPVAVSDTLPSSIYASYEDQNPRTNPRY